jgi:acetyl-CoA acetyltransferase
MPNASRISNLSGMVAVVGVGDTDYRGDYEGSRQSYKSGANQPTGSHELAVRALKRALDDAALDKSAIDGLVVGSTLSYERTAELVGLDVRWADEGHDAAQSIISATMAITTGLATTVALVHGNNQRSAGLQYGGPHTVGSERRAYTYYAPWGLTSQGGLYALMVQRYMRKFDLDEAELGIVAIRQREFATKNPNAIMREPMTIDDYLESRYIVAPLHLFDYCLVNDGGVAIILSAVDRASEAGRTQVVIDGVGWSDLNKSATSLAPRLLDFYHTAHRQTADQVYGMADCDPSAIDCLQIYDSFSSHVLFALEGFEFCSEGMAPRFLAQGGKDGAILPVNTSGGHLSESYMQGWNHQVEAVRQLRSEAGERQVANCRRVQYIFDGAGKVKSLIYRRAE